MSITHEALARQNFIQSSNAETHEWRITMLFYAAVHAVNHVFFGNQQAPIDFRHIDREARITTDPRLRTIEREYRQLKQISTISRYQPANHPMSVSKSNHAYMLAVRVLNQAGVATATAPAKC